MKGKLATIGLGQLSGYSPFSLESEEPMGEYRAFVWKPGPRDDTRKWSARQTDFSQFFDRGGCLILFLEKGSEFRHILPSDFPIFAQKLTGLNVEVVDNTVGKLVAPYFSEKPKFTAVLNVTKGTFHPIAFTPGNQKHVALWTQFRNGFVCALPYDREKADAAVKVIPRLDNFLSKQTPKVAVHLGNLPDWTQKYQFVEEQKAAEAKRALEAQLEQIQNEIPQLVQTINSFNNYMYYFSEDGKTLDSLVRTAMTEIGFLVEDGPDLNSYAVLRYGNRNAILLTKATTGPISDKEARQVEVWKSHYEGYIEQLPKGFLVINAYRQLDILSRGRESFSPQFVAYAEATGICALTTIQLVGMLMELKSHPQNQDKVIKMLFDTNGPIKGYDEPLRYLVQKVAAA